MITSGQRWLRRLTTADAPGGRPRVRLVALPHAGGAASFYHRWARLLPRDVELMAVQYPGRQDRADEPCAVTMPELADPIAAALTSMAGPTMAVFGHSMGAAVAVEVTRRLEERTGRPLLRLFVSGRPAPHRQHPTAVHSGGDDALLADLRRLGGTDESLLAQPGLREMVLPSLRADYRLIERYRPATAAPLRTPITALCGDRDPEVSPEEAAAWREQTSGDFRAQVLDGDHFYVTERPVAAVRAVLADVRPRFPLATAWPSTP
ncbi:alpha/beta fold hydrolase [Verrucosispora sp. WMMC514]|uniref:thioesterase II family protein n=1 Tax=Verrucosispora sp. WMMC514 TaxID=3015156 RepID=UPI00248D2823|nr:alpha/beta fold hydrolase [Verrucosispora sp. WMMC514]WBB94521.1 alpha/beta fold hydrolase [Verrucosispora sp. WMMC514]